MKRILALVLALLMVAVLFAGCTKGGETTNTPAPASNSGSSNSGSSGSSNSGSTEPAGEGPVANVWPIVTDGSVTYTLWRSLDGTAAPFIDSYGSEKNYVYPEIQKRTGINIEWICPAAANVTEAFQVLVLSDDYPDAISGAVGYYTGGADKAISDGFIIRLNELVETYSPNYMGWVNSTEGNRPNTRTDEGNMPEFCMGYDRVQPAFAGYAVRGDWLEEMGMARPETITEWHDMLAAFRDRYGCVGPMELVSSGAPNNAFFLGAYGVRDASNGFIQKDGVVEYSCISQGYRDFLELFQTWYAEGLIDPDFVTNSAQTYGIFPNNTRVANNQSAAITCMYTYAGSYLADVGVAEPGANFVLVKSPVLNKGDELLTGFKGLGESNLSMGVGYAISSTCPQPELICRFFDYFYSDEGMVLTNYGIEGVTYTVDANGKRMHTDLIAHNPDGMTTTAAQTVYLMHNGTGIFMLDREEDAQSETALEYRDLWSVRGKWNLVGSLTYTPEEGAERSAIVNDVTTYIQEFTCNVIMGRQALNDSTWNEYVAKIEAMGIARAVELTQAAYDRYLTR